MKLKKKKGFTLIELVIVLAVLAIIALIAIPNFTRVRNNALIQADETSSEQITNIVQTAIAEGVLEPVVGKDYSNDLSISAAGVITFVATSGKTAIPYNLTFGGGNNATNAANAMTDHLRDIEAPQEAGETHYQIVIDATGRVKTTTEKKS
ncbi:MAG: prepilin-type N-terminal cleavage/methylation domain-containing protein [Sarcina sp.]